MVAMRIRIPGKRTIWFGYEDTRLFGKSPRQLLVV